MRNAIDGQLLADSRLQRPIGRCFTKTARDTLQELRARRRQYGFGGLLQLHKLGVGETDRFHRITSATTAAPDKMAAIVSKHLFELPSEIPPKAFA